MYILENTKRKVYTISVIQYSVDSIFVGMCLQMCTHMRSFLASCTLYVYPYMLLHFF